MPIFKIVSYIRYIKFLNLTLLITCFTLFVAFTTFLHPANAYSESYPEATYAVASWYGPYFHGRQTASGEIFDMYNFTCAHKEYPFGTKLKIINLSNNRSVNCLVNDRGPFIEGRDLDLSYATAKEIGMIEPGVSIVKVEYIKENNKYMRSFTIQVGSFKEISNAMGLKEAIEQRYNRVYITEAYVDGDKYYRVRIGKINGKDEAYHLAKVIEKEGYDVMIVRYDEKI
jgi:rare lipoprotein A